MQLQLLTIIPQFKVTETYSVGGSVKLKRRDMRHGAATAVSQRLPCGGVHISTSWGEPISGGMEESYTLAKPGELHVHSTLVVGARRATTLQVRDAWRGGQVGQPCCCILSGDFHGL